MVEVTSDQKIVAEYPLLSGERGDPVAGKKKGSKRLMPNDPKRALGGKKMKRGKRK